MYRGDLHRDPLFSEILHIQRVNEGRGFISVVLFLFNLLSLVVKRVALIV